MLIFSIGRIEKTGLFVRTLADSMYVEWPAAGYIGNAAASASNRCQPITYKPWLHWQKSVSQPMQQNRSRTSQTSYILTFDHYYQHYGPNR
jgi:hypothetical protein